jgi:integrating conjugative element protein (TIGR03755 family)
MKHTFARTTLLALAIAFVLSPGAHAQTALYYEIGGAEPLIKPNWTGYNAVPFSLDASASWSYSCGKFDVQQTVSQLMSNVRTAADEYLNLMVANAQAAVSSLPAILIQRANPTLYDIMQNGLLRVQAQANAARLDCQAMEETIMASGGGPAAVWDNFRQAAKLQDWKVSASYQRNNVVAAAATVESNAGKNGIAWIGGRAGGLNQRPIKMHADVMAEGWRRARASTRPGLPAREAASKSASAAGPSVNVLGSLFNWFGTEDSAKSWITRVAGETTATTTADGEKTTTPGSGLTEEVRVEAERIIPLLRGIVFRNTPITNAERTEISTGTQISDQLIKALRELPKSDRVIMITRLSNEIAMQNEIGRALMALAIFRLGASHPNVSGAANVSTENDRIIVLIKGYIEDVLYESRIRKELVSESAMAIIDRAQAQRSSPIIRAERTDKDEPTLGTQMRNAP